jgi:phosphoglycolate phosphatase
MTIKLAIFDFDGTLADSFAWFTSVVNGVADKYRFRRIEPHEVDTLRGKGAGELVHLLGVPAWKLPLIANHMRKIKARDRALIPLFEGSDALVRRLSRGGVAIAVVCSYAESNVRAALGPALAPLVAHYACGASLFGKARKFEAVLRRAGLPPGEAICIGDEIRDLEAARAAGIPFGAVAWGYTRLDALRAHDPALVFHSIEEIGDRLCGAEPLARTPAIG